MEEALSDLLPPRRRRSRLFAWVVVLLVTLTTVALIAVIAILVAERELARRIYPNISVRGIPVGGLTLEEAQRTVEQTYSAFLYSPIELQYGERTWLPSPAELGVHLKLDEALAEAFALGRNATRADNLRHAAAVWQQGYDLPLHLEVDQTVLQRYLRQVASAVELPPQDASLSLVGPYVSVAPEVWGTQSLVDATLTDITAALQSLTRQPIGLRTRRLAPRLREATIAPVAAQLQRLLAAPVTLTGTTGACAQPQGCRWVLTPAQIASWLSVHRVTAANGEPTYSVNLDPTGIRSALVPIAAAVREEGTLPQVAWNGGKLRIIVPGQPGRGLDASQALTAISAALASAQRTLSLPLTPLPPPVTAANLAALGITTEVGRGVSSFARSEAYRITNIRAGARRMHGVLIPPGASFSFNTQLGAVNAANGFVPGLAIVANRTQKEWGGGLCQVSTTVFRAAFFAGLPITERHEHAFRIGWYEELGEPPGLDAAIFTPANDMRFTNDTGGWLLLESYVDTARQRLTVALYGAPTGRQVTYAHRVIKYTAAPTTPVYVNDPTKPSGYFRQSDTARGGMQVIVYRTITAAGQPSVHDSFFTEFHPWPNIYVRGTRR